MHLGFLITYSVNELGEFLSLHILLLFQHHSRDPLLAYQSSCRLFYSELCCMQCGDFCVLASDAIRFDQQYKYMFRLTFRSEPYTRETSSKVWYN